MFTIISGAKLYFHFSPCGRSRRKAADEGCFEVRSFQQLKVLFNNIATINTKHPKGAHHATNQPKQGI